MTYHLRTKSLVILVLLSVLVFVIQPRAHLESLLSPVDRAHVVISQYDEWDDGEPHWLSEIRKDSRYEIQDGYQRRVDWDRSNFVPNNGFESGVYMRYIVDHYLNLPPFIVFIQADACGIDVPKVLNLLNLDILSQAGGYLPLNCHKVFNRGFETWQGSLRVQECWSALVEHFHIGHLLNISSTAYHTTRKVDGETKVNLVCCACFAVSRDQLRLTPYETWASFYKQAIEKGSCVHGREDESRGKHETAGAMEHLAHMIFGRRYSLWDPKCIDDFSNKGGQREAPGPHDDGGGG